MGFLQDHSQSATATATAPVSTPTSSTINDLLSQGPIAGGSPAQTINPATMAQRPSASPGPVIADLLTQGPIAGSSTDAAPTVDPAAIPQTPIPQGPNFLQRLGIDSNGLPSGTGVGGKRSILDILGGLADGIATVGGSAPMYQPSLDANKARQQIPR